MRRETWTDEEVQRLRQLYSNPNKTFEEVVSEFPGRTMNSIRLKACRLGLERPRVLYGTYSVAVEKLKDAYGRESIREIKAILEDALDILEPGWRMDP